MTEGPLTLRTGEPPADPDSEGLLTIDVRYHVERVGLFLAILEEEDGELRADFLPFSDPEVIMFETAIEAKEALHYAGQQGRVRVSIDGELV